MEKTHPLGDNTNCIDVFFEMPVLVPMKNSRLRDSIIKRLDSMMEAVPLSEFIKSLVEGQNEHELNSIMSFLSDTSVAKKGVTLYDVLHEGDITQVIHDCVAKMVEAREAITDHIVKIANTLDRHVKDPDYIPGTPSAQSYAARFREYKKQVLLELCDLCGNYIALLRVVEYFVVMSTPKRQSEEPPVIEGVKFGWVKATSRLGLDKINCLTDERICTLYILLDARITLLTLADENGTLEEWNASLYTKDVDKASIKIGHECGVCMSMISALLHDADQTKKAKPERLTVLCDYGLIPPMDALSCLYKWLFLYKKHATVLNIVRTRGLRTMNKDHNQLQYYYTIGMSMWCDKLFAQMSQTDRTLKPWCKDIKRVFKWAFVCAHINKLLRLYYKMEACISDASNLESAYWTDVETALYWSDQIDEVLDSDINKKIDDYQTQLHGFQQEHGMSNDVAFYTEFKPIIDSLHDASDDRPLKIIEILFENRFIKGFSIQDYSLLVSKVKKLADSLEVDNNKIYKNVAKKPEEEEDDQERISKILKKIEVASEEEIHSEWESIAIKSQAWNIIIGVSRYIWTWCKTRVADHL